MRRALAGFLLLWVLVPIALPVVEAVDAALPPGIFDDADDDNLIAVLTSLDLTLIAPIPPPPPELPSVVAGPAPVPTDLSALSLSPVPSSSRSPPLA
jgi:hypothetical protein